MQWVGDKPLAFDGLLLYTLKKGGGVISRAHGV